MEIARLRAAEKFAKIGSGKAICQGCGFTYDPTKGDPEYPVSAGTQFQVRGLLSASWVSQISDTPPTGSPLGACDCFPKSSPLPVQFCESESPPWPSGGPLLPCQTHSPGTRASLPPRMKAKELERRMGGGGRGGLAAGGLCQGIT